MAARGFLGRDLTLALDRQAGPDAMARRLAEFSRERLAQAIASGEGAPNYITYVNGRKDAPEESVTAPGPIVYVFNWWPEIITDAMRYLRSRSPLSPARGGHKGRKPYRDSFFVMAEGVEVFTRHYKDISPDAEVTITNDAPYSRKLDLQLIGGKSLSVSVPPGIFEDAVQAISADWGALINVKRAYTVGFSGQWIRRRGETAGKPVHSPALIMTPWG
jgi:hypothetical protein